VFTAALNRRALREFVEAPPPPQVNERTEPLPDTDEARAHLGELFDWIFGENKIIKDSRQLRDLALVVDSPSALGVLRESRDLEEAYAAAGGPQQQIVKRLRTATDAIRNSVNDLNQHSTLIDDPDIAETARDCLDVANTLAELLPDDEN
jgi:hypothetical protein